MTAAQLVAYGVASALLIGFAAGYRVGRWVGR